MKFNKIPEQNFDEEPVPLNFLKKPLQPYSELWGIIQKNAKERSEFKAQSRKNEEKNQKVLCNIALEFFELRKILNNETARNMEGEVRHDLVIWMDNAIKMLEKEGIRIVDPLNISLDHETLEKVEVRGWLEDGTISRPAVHETLSPWIFKGDRLINIAVVIGKTPKKN